MISTQAPETRAPRAEAFIDAAQRLIQAKGYERMSIQDVLDATDASRGAFYHYFDSKQALLQAVVARMVDAALASVAPILNDPNVPAIEKLRGMFGGIGSWKSARADLMRSLIDVWLSDDNAVVREQFRASLIPTLTPVLARVIDQGRSEGALATGDPSSTARVLVSLIQAANETATELFVARKAGLVSFEEVEATLLAYFAAFERVLGAPAGSLDIPERPALLRQWFD